MRKGFLSVRQEADTVVSFSDKLPPSRQADEKGRLRISPIFAAAGDAETPLAEPDGTISFLVFERPYQAIARIRTAKPDLFSRIWYSHGLASVIAFNVPDRDLDLVTSDASLGFRGAEIWHVSTNVVRSSEVVFSPPAMVKAEDYALVDYRRLDSDSRVLLEEFEMCLRTAILLASQYAPRHLRVFSALTAAVNELVTEMQFLLTREGSPPESLPEGTWDDANAVESEIQRRLHQRVGQLVQINSAFSYVISQAFTGTFPLSETECQIRRHSLLGVGTAVNAVAAFARFVESVFEKYPIDEAIDTLYDLASGVEIWPLLPTSFDPQQWTDDKYHIDTFLGRMACVPNEPRLAFYSGRLGFRESEFAVTAALQVLSAGDSIRWSLMTMSHELMHAHVRAVMSVLFDEKNQGADTSFRRYYQDLEQIVRGRKQASDLTLRACLRTAILNFVTIKPTLSQIAAGRATDADVRLLRYPELKEVLADEFAYINHIFVHVFDYYYFYNAKDPVYLRLLWESWATVPAVLENVAEYVLRSIVTVSTAQEGTTTERFNLALNIVKQALNELALQANSTVARSALAYLEDANNYRWLNVMFVPSSYLAELAAKLLVASSVHGALLEDDNADPDDLGCRYVLESGEFVDTEIESPVAFVLDRLRRQLTHASAPATDEEYYSAWSLLVCASGLR
jgi:hypothetical protein